MEIGKWYFPGRGVGNRGGKVRRTFLGFQGCCCGGNVMYVRAPRTLNEADFHNHSLLIT